MASKTRTAIRRIATLLLWSGVLAGFVVLVAAAVEEKDTARCKSIKVSFSGDDRNAFIDEKDIRALILKDRTKNPTGMAVSEINISNLEKIVEADPWVRSAELYIDNRQVLNIEVVQRDPLARVFTFSGNSFYLDEQNERIPVSDRFSARVPVFTGFPTEAAKLRKEDSLLYRQIGAMARYIAADTFWNAQVEQIVITGDRKFEIIPKLGDHVIVFGEGNNIEKKFARLLVFYQKGLSKAGWNTYSRINIAYHEEVIGTRRDGKSAPPPPMYRDSTVADVAMEEEHAAPAATNPPEPAAKPASATAPKPTARKPEKQAGRKPKAVYPEHKRNNRN